MYCRTYDIGVKGIVPEGREMIMPGEDASMTLYASKRMVCLFDFIRSKKIFSCELFRFWKKVLDLHYVMRIIKPLELV
jgi:hypothetical protein